MRVCERADTMHNKNRPAPRMTRRSFLRDLSITVSGGLLAACSAPRVTVQQALLGPEATPQVILPGPAAAMPPPDDLPLAEFLALSALLTGVENLSPEIGRTYLQSLQAGQQLDITVHDLLEQAGFTSARPPATLDELEATDILQNEPARELAGKIIEYWYTGIYETPEGEQQVATFVDSLAWRTLRFTKPPTICGSPDFWTEPPEITID